MNPPLPELCQRTLEAIQAAPLDLPAELEAHAARCIACREARVHWLAMEDGSLPLVPAAYFETLPERILRKLPTRPVRRLRAQPLLWAAAAGLMAAAGIGGYWAGRATPQAPPTAAASLPETETLEALPEAPFADGDDPVNQLGGLTPKEAQAVARKLAIQHARIHPRQGSKP